MEEYNGTGDADIRVEREALVGRPIEFALAVQYAWTMKMGGLQIHYLEGSQPNRFHRWMSRYLLGVEWMKY